MSSNALLSRLTGYALVVLFVLPVCAACLYVGCAGGLPETSIGLPCSPSEPCPPDAVCDTGLGICVAPGDSDAAITFRDSGVFSDSTSAPPPDVTPVDGWFDVTSSGSP